MISNENYLLRKDNINASAVGKILGYAPDGQGTADDVLREMVRLHFDAPRVELDNIAVNYGSECELIAFDSRNAEIQKSIDAGNTQLKEYLCDEINTTYDIKQFVGAVGWWFGATPDGVLRNNKYGLEIKVPFGKTGRIKNQKNREKLGTTECLEPMCLPDGTVNPKMMHYYCQIQVQAFVWGFDAVRLYQWVSENAALEEWVPRDDAFLSSKMDALNDFYDLFIKTIDSPELSKRHLQPLVATVDESSSEYDDMMKNITQLQLLEQDAKIANEAIKQFKDSLKSQVIAYKQNNDVCANKLALPRYNDKDALLTLFTTNRKKVDTDKLYKDNGISQTVVDSYTKVSSSTSFRVTL